MNLHLIRHAPVIGKHGVIYGDDAELNLVDQEGRIAYLAKALPDPSCAVWCTSGVDRTVRSALAVLERVGKGSQGAECLSTLKEFREQDFGNLIGQTYEEAAPYIEIVKGSIIAATPPGGESIDTLIQRVRAAIDNVRQIALKHHYGNVVIFTHRGTIRAAHLALQELPVTTFSKIDVEPLSLHTFTV